MIYGSSKLSKTEISVFVILLVSTVLSFLSLSAGASGDGLLHIYFLNVGQGDATLIQTPDNVRILVDGGPDNRLVQELAKVMSFDDNSIDMLVLSHPHLDHFAGLIEVLKRYEVGTILENYIPYNTAGYDEWNAVKNKARVIEARSGQVFDLGNDIKLTVLFPYDSGTSLAKVKNAHNFMTVFRLDYGTESVLFTGDMEDELERRLVYGGADLDVDFLKVGHHGSKTSTSNEFLNATTPVLAFMSLGAKNRYGHPHPTIIQRLENYAIKYYRTDVDGASDLQLDGQRYLVKNF